MSINVAFIIPMADIIFLGIIAFFAFYGFKRGVLRTLYSILRVYFSFIITILFYEKLALLFQAMFDISSVAARIVGFAILFLALVSIIWTIGIFLKKRISKEFNPDSDLSKIGGCVLGLLEGVLIISIGIMDINFYPVPEGAKSPLESAVSYKVIEQVAPGIEHFTISPFSRLREIPDVSKPDESESDSP